MTYRKLLFIIGGMLISTALLAQNAQDALRYSSTNTAGSARFMALSGAMGAVGGDISTINFNPAGLGIYKSSEYIIAPRYLFNKEESSYGGYNSTDRRDNFNYGMAGLVSAMPLFSQHDPNPTGWKYMQFGFSFNRIDNYRSDILIQGNSYGGSKVFEWRDQANGNLPDNLNLFGSNLAWETYLLDTVNGYPTNYNAATPSGGVYQSYNSRTEGYKNEMSFAFSGNYNDRLFIGASLSWSFLNYFNTVYYSETSLDNPAPGEFDNFTYIEELGTRGNGINGKFGLIYIVNPIIRISGAIHTPTWYYRMTDTYFSKVESQMANGQTYSKTSPNGRYEYNMNTPFKAMGGMSFFIQKMGFISVDYIYQDYSQAYLKSDYDSFYDENENINNDFTATHSVNIGTEWRFQPFFVRAGYGFTTSPVKEEINDITQNQFSFGLGYRSGPFFMDASFMQKYNAQNYYMYGANYVSPAYIETKTSYYSLSLGFKF